MRNAGAACNPPHEAWCSLSQRHGKGLARWPHQQPGKQRCSSDVAANIARKIGLEFSSRSPCKIITGSHPRGMKRDRDAVAGEGGDHGGLIAEPPWPAPGLHKAVRN